MTTDKLFYEFFQLAPYTLFELLQIEPPCEYVFSSPAVKASERRLDGLLEPSDPDQPRYFLEIQGYDDRTIYWRTLHELSFYHEINPTLNGKPSYAVVLFLDAGYDPGVATLGTVQSGHESWLRRGVIPDMLKRVGSGSAALNVLLPLCTDSEEALAQNGANWTQEIRDAAELDDATQVRLLKLLTQFVMQKFTTLNRKEIDKMLQLTPIEETVAGKEYIKEGQIDIIAEILLSEFNVDQLEIERLLLEELSNEQLRLLVRYIVRANSFEQVEAWVEEQLESDD